MGADLVHKDPPAAGPPESPKRNPYHAAAQDMYMLEHTRWNHHTLLFLGIIASVLAVAHEVMNIVPLEVTAVLAAAVSFLWLCAVQNNRASSYAWMKTLEHLEENVTGTKPFHKFLEERRKFGIVRDFFSNFGVKPNGEQPRGFLLFSAVTRIHAALAILLIVTFLLFAWNRFDVRTAQPEDDLGRLLVRGALATKYSNSKIADAFGPLMRRDGIKVIQLHIVLPTEEHVITNWRLEGSGPVLETNPPNAL